MQKYHQNITTSALTERNLKQQQCLTYRQRSQINSSMTCFLPGPVVFLFDTCYSLRVRELPFQSKPGHENDQQQLLECVFIETQKHKHIGNLFLL